MTYNYSILNNNNNNNDDINNIKDVKSFFIYVINHYEKFLLFLLACIIIYLVDYLSNINALIYGAPQIIPGLSNPSNSKNINVKKLSTNKRSRNKK
uniref:Uncharacterized protein n=1 Tax=viral metagenome TaxID=1070528 RepID=A0A6C0IDD2_9ZZZZ